MQFVVVGEMKCKVCALRKREGGKQGERGRGGTESGRERGGRGRGVREKRMERGKEREGRGKSGREIGERERERERDFPDLSLQSIVRIIQTLNDNHLVVGCIFWIDLHEQSEGIDAEVLPVVAT